MNMGACQESIPGPSPTPMKNHPSLLGFVLASAGMILPWVPATALADFRGSDRLTAPSANWAELYPGSSRRRLLFEDGGLIYRTHSGTDGRIAYLVWTPNKGSMSQDWFVEVLADLNGEDDAEIGIAVIHGANRRHGYMVTVSGGEDFNAIRAETIGGHARRNSVGVLDRARLRLHFDSRAQTITASWRTRVTWHHLKSFPIRDWKMPADGRFRVVLVGVRQRSLEDDDWDGWNRQTDFASSPLRSSIRPYFADFRCGDSQPELMLESPADRPLALPPGLRFGSTNVGGSGITRELIIRNQGTAPLRQLELRKSGRDAADFIAHPRSLSALAPGEAARILVSFKPRASGLRQASLWIESNDPDENPCRVELSGRGAVPR